MNQAPITMRHERLDQTEIKDFLVCFLYIVKNLSEGQGQGHGVKSLDSETVDNWLLLTHCGLVTPYGCRDLGHNWFR